MLTRYTPSVQYLTYLLLSLESRCTQRRADMILALLNLFTLIAYFSACLASKEPSMK